MNWRILKYSIVFGRSTFKSLNSYKNKLSRGYRITFITTVI